MTVAQETSIQVPKTAAELHALEATRGELMGQLGMMNARRAQLADQIARSDASTRGELQTRLRDVDARIRTLESRLDASNDAMTQALARGVGQNQATAGEAVPALPPTPPVPPLPPTEHVIHVPPPPGGWTDVAVSRALVLEGVGFLLLGAVLYQWMRRRFSRGVPAVDAQALSTMQQSIDAIALEVERISENQRFVTKLLNEGSRPAEPVKTHQREPARD